MNWDSFLGHADVIDRFQRSMDRERVASSFLFVGPSGVGKRTFALLLAKSMLCERSDPKRLECCNECPACTQVDASSHPDVEVISKPKDRNFIPIDLLIGDREHRMREGLCHRISLKSFAGGRKFAIIDDADFLNQEDANCLLKTLEEPPMGAIMILVGTSEQRQLPTIRSRCQTVRFQPLTDEHLCQLLIKQQVVEDPNEAQSLASLAGGSLDAAIELNDSSIREFRQIFLMQLASLDPGRNRFLKELTAFVDSAGKDASPRRNRMRLLADWAILFYGELMRALSGAGATSNDPVLGRAVEVALEKSNSAVPMDGGAAGDCIQRCLDTHRHISANANQSTMIESWLSDLGKIARREYLGVG